MSLTEAKIQEIIEDIVRRYAGTINHPGKGIIDSNSQGCFENIESAVCAAKESQKLLASLSLAVRKKIIQSMRQAALDNAKKLAAMAHEETGFGRVEDKVLKNILAAEKTPGVEDIVSTTYTGDYGLTLVEGAPYGVIGAITPSTNPSSTIINNSISMVAAGNSVVYNPHPGAKKTSIETIRILNESIVKAGGPKNLLCTAANPTIETSNQIMKHDDIKLLVVTGGEAVVKVAMKSGKKVIAAGPGNPPVIVDNTANIPKAAADIVKGAAFDNNILCIAEKEVFVFNDVADLLVSEMVKRGCYLAKDSEIQKIMDTVLEINKEGKYVPNKKFVGKNAGYILKQSGIDTNTDYRLVIARVNNGHPFVMTEMLMPVLPIVNVSNLDEAINAAVAAENEYGHTAIMHSENVIHLTKAARALNTTIFVKNAPSYAGLGFEGEGYTTLTIATPTGEGLTSAKAFTRQRRCTLSGSFRIV
jgi:acyl-CoA reductase-like NAD-dependent aldehyde dehydrogenase